MENLKKKQTIMLLSILAILLICFGATYAWFTHNRLADTDSVSARTNEDTVNLYVSTKGGKYFKNAHEAEIDQINSAEKEAIMPVSTADLDEFVYASVSTPNAFKLARVDNEAYYYHGRVYLKAVTTGNHKGQRLTVYLDGSELGDSIITAEDNSMLSASRVGLAIGGNSTIINFDNSRADNVASYSNGKISYVNDPSNYIKKYILEISGGKAKRPEKTLMNLELNKEYPLDIYYYLEGCDADCSEKISEEDVTLKLAFYGVLE